MYNAYYMATRAGVYRPIFTVPAWEETVLVRHPGRAAGEEFCHFDDPPPPVHPY